MPLATEDLRPWTVAGAAGIATFAAICRFDFGGARRMPDSAAPYHERISDRTTLCTELDGGRWRPEWPPIPSTFLADALGAARPP